MAVEAKKSTVITNATATPATLNSANLQNGNMRRAVAFANIVSADSVASTYRLFRIRSSDVIDMFSVYSPDIGTTTAGDIGLYRTNGDGGAVVDVDFIASALSLNGGALNGSDLRFEAAAAGGLIANAEKRVWECLGLTSDPGIEYDVVLTLTGAADASGVALFRMTYVSGE